jgi:hypothetical protein
LTLIRDILTTPQPPHDIYVLRDYFAPVPSVHADQSELSIRSSKTNADDGAARTGDHVERRN